MTLLLSCAQSLSSTGPPAPSAPAARYPRHQRTATYTAVASFAAARPLLKEERHATDIGAGTGYFTVRLAESTPARTVFAVDIEPAMVDYVRERAAEAGLEQVVGVVAEPDSPNLPEAVDVVLIVNTFHHIPDRVAPRPRRLLLRAARLARAGCTAGDRRSPEGHSGRGSARRVPLHARGDRRRVESGRLRVAVTARLPSESDLPDLRRGRVRTGTLRLPIRSCRVSCRPRRTILVRTVSVYDGRGHSYPEHLHHHRHLQGARPHMGRGEQDGDMIS